MVSGGRGTCMTRGQEDNKKVIPRTSGKEIACEVAETRQILCERFVTIEL
jgi:hypothetical protein